MNLHACTDPEFFICPEREGGSEKDLVRQGRSERVGGGGPSLNFDGNLIMLL